ncbi:MAG: iron-containing alcohol dehydrogenase [Tannerella sp.]|jgi:alcohol dehydrogenase class IV|nr:iron-containing alcohol dehydrogenase [Tannerella sp.]
MLEQVATSTKIIQTDLLTAQDLDRLIFYCGGEAARPCVVMDRHPLPARDGMLAGLRKMRPVELLDQVYPDPKVSDIMEMVEVLRDKGINVIIGIGGGSSLDSAKAVAAVLSNGGHLEDYLGPDPVRRIGKREVKLILIPTTAGTGSEVTRVGVYTSRSGRKYTLGSPLMQADIALLVTEYVRNLPPALTASTSFDALSHALETLWNCNATALSDRIATESAIHLLKWMETAYDSSVSGGDRGRAEVLAGACMAGIGFSMTGTAAVHALSFIFSEEWHVPHGVACAFMLEDVFRLNRQNESTAQKLAFIARALFGEGEAGELTDKLSERITALKRKFGLPFTFGDLNIELREDRIGELFNRSLEDPKMKNNIVSVDGGIIFELIKNKTG